MNNYEQMELFQMSSPADSPAPTSVEHNNTSQQVLINHDPGCGRNTLGLSEKLNQHGQSLKTCPCSVEEDCMLFLATYGRSGTTRNGIAYQRPQLVPLTRETGSGSSRWPTPTSRDWKDGSADSCRNVPANCLLGREVHARENYQTTGSLTPMFCEWLMGFPIGWTDLSSSATP